LSRRFLPEAAAWQDGRELFIGILVVAVVACSFLFARYTQQRVTAVA
jgi:hypothetical protein